MHRSAILKLQRQFMSQNQMMNRATNTKPPCDVFINHRGIDTKRTVGTLLYDQLYRLNLTPFLDNKNMKPGDKLFENINRAIRQCKVGVAVLSPRYCESYFCLHELALIMETKKKVIPIFCDIKPSHLRINIDKAQCSPEDIRRFNWALEETKYTVGLTFDSLKGNWSEVVTSATDIVIKSLIEIENEKYMLRRKIQIPPVHCIKHGNMLP
ncbi:probable 2' cyclic ADP-D-ribose synthase BdTIR [Euphorbia lathyris]|uniref:probable 2' cyclic ADP-D-ribose synthase BdTIR n=1 Tax=Euphorbia lathyris TaxID=212925 RepID=UPI0033137DEF